jgi:uncharacterized protein (DUF488 family)
MIRVYTIGFTQKSAEQFFTRLRGSGVQRVVDVRLNNVSQLAGFAKKDDLRFFLREVCGIDYLHCSVLAPTQPMLDAYRKAGGDWSEYEKRFLDLMAERRIEDEVDPALLHGGCLLCSEHQPHQCHRRLVAEYLAARWDGVEVEHLT